MIEAQALRLRHALHSRTLARGRRLSIAEHLLDGVLPLDLRVVTESMNQMKDGLVGLHLADIPASRGNLRRGRAPAIDVIHLPQPDRLGHIRNELMEGGESVLGAAKHGLHADAGREALPEGVLQACEALAWLRGATFPKLGDLPVEGADREPKSDLRLV